MAKRKAQREKDTRKILRGVQLPEVEERNGRKVTTLHTFVEGQEDDLEERLTPSQVEYLTGAGAIEGDWSPGRKDRADARPLKADPGVRRSADESADGTTADVTPGEEGEAQPAEAGEGHHRRKKEEGE